MVKRRVRAKNAKQALKRARAKYPNRVVTKVNWLKSVKENKKGKSYEVVSRKRKK